MKIFFPLLTVAAVILSADFDNLEAWTIRMTCRLKGREIELCKNAINEWVKKHGGKHKVEMVTLPHASNECFALYQQWLSAETFDIDVMYMDAVWVGVFSDYLYPLNKAYASNEIDADDYFDAVRKSMYSTEGSMIALPLYVDCGVMYYRKDLLEKYDRAVPTTWEELYDTALYIQNEERKRLDGKGKFHGLLFQARAFEILTCNFLEFIDSFGGTIVQNRKAAVDSDASIAAVMFMAKCINSVTNRSALNYSEEDSRGVFQSGNAVFMRNWPYAWALINEPSSVVAGKIGVMPIPKSKNGGKNSGSLGGWFLVVSKYSKHPKVAADLVKFLTSKTQQKYRARYSYPPAFKSLYQDKSVIGFNPFFKKLFNSLNSGVARPSVEFGKNYTRASSEIYNTVNAILAQSTESNVTKEEVERQLKRLNKKLDRLLSTSMKKVEKKANSKESGSSFFWKKVKNLLRIEK